MCLEYQKYEFDVGTKAKLMTTSLIGLTFHGVGPPQRELDPSEDRYWISVPFFEEILDRIAAAPNADRIRLSFDDSNLSDHDVVLPRLLARGLTADFFVLTGRIGSRGSLDAEQIRALRAAGMRIGSHGIDHLRWPQIDDQALWHELTESRRVLEDICGEAVTEAAVPFGDYNARVLRALRKAGYATVYSSDGGGMDPKSFPRSRTSIRADMTNAHFDLAMSGRRSRLRRLRSRIGKLRRRLMARLRRPG